MVFAQANQLDKLLTLKQTVNIKAQKLMRDYGYQKAIWDWRAENQ